MHTNKGRGSRGSGHDKQRTKMPKKTNIKLKPTQSTGPPTPLPSNIRTPIGVSGGGGGSEMHTNKGKRSRGSGHDK